MAATVQGASQTPLKTTVTSVDQTIAERRAYEDGYYTTEVRRLEEPAENYPEREGRYVVEENPAEFYPNTNYDNLPEANAERENDELRKIVGDMQRSLKQAVEKIDHLETYVSQPVYASRPPPLPLSPERYQFADEPYRTYEPYRAYEPRLSEEHLAYLEGNRPRMPEEPVVYEDRPRFGEEHFRVASEPFDREENRRRLTEEEPRKRMEEYQHENEFDGRRRPHSHEFVDETAGRNEWQNGGQMDADAEWTPKRRTREHANRREWSSAPMELDRKRVARDSIQTANSVEEFARPGVANGNDLSHEFGHRRDGHNRVRESDEKPHHERPAKKHHKAADDDFGLTTFDEDCGCAAGDTSIGPGIATFITGENPLDVIMKDLGLELPGNGTLTSNDTSTDLNASVEKLTMIGHDNKQKATKQAGDNTLDPFLELNDAMFASLSMPTTGAARQTASATAPAPATTPTPTPSPSPTSATATAPATATTKHPETPTPHQPPQTVSSDATATNVTNPTGNDNNNNNGNGNETSDTVKASAGGAGGGAAPMMPSPNQPSTAPNPSTTVAADNSGDD